MTREPRDENEPEVHIPRMCDAALSQVFDLLGKRWSGVILGTLAIGPSGFSQLKRAITGISDSMLSERLVELAGAGVIERTVDVGPPVSVEYRLTASGDALVPTLNGLTDWARQNLPRPTADDPADGGADEVRLVSSNLSTR